MSRPGSSSLGQHSGLEAFREVLLEAGRCPEEWSAGKSTVLLDSLRRSIARSQRRAQTLIAVVGCAAAFFSGVWVASQGFMSYRDIAKQAPPVTSALKAT